MVMIWQYVANMIDVSNSKAALESIGYSCTFDSEVRKQLRRNIAI
jgi:hypothetical protein